MNAISTIAIVNWRGLSPPRLSIQCFIANNSPTVASRLTNAKIVQYRLGIERKLSIEDSTKVVQSRMGKKREGETIWKLSIRRLCAVGTILAERRERRNGN